MLYIIGFEAINFYIFFIKANYFGSKLFFKNKELLTITKNAGILLYSGALQISVQNFMANGQTVLVLALREHIIYIFTYFVSRSPLKFSWRSSLTLARGTCSFISVLIFLLNIRRDNFYQKYQYRKGKTHVIHSIVIGEHNKKTNGVVEKVKKRKVIE